MLLFCYCHVLRVNIYCGLTNSMMAKGEVKLSRLWFTDNPHCQNPPNTPEWAELEKSYMSLHLF